MSNVGPPDPVPPPPAPTPTATSMNLVSIVNTVNLDQIMSASVHKADSCIKIKQGTTTKTLKWNTLGLPNVVPERVNKDSVLYGIVIALFNKGGLGGEARDFVLTWDNIFERPRVVGWPSQSSTREEIQSVLAKTYRDMRAAPQWYPYRDTIIDVLKALYDMKANWTASAARPVQRMLFELHQCLRGSQGLPPSLAYSWRREYFSNVVAGRSVKDNILNNPHWKRHLTNHTAFAAQEVQSFRDGSDVEAMESEALDRALTQVLLAFPDHDNVTLRVWVAGYASIARQHGVSDVASMSNWIIESVTTRVDEVVGSRNRVAALEASVNSLTNRLAEATAAAIAAEGELAAAQERIVELELNSRNVPGYFSWLTRFLRKSRGWAGSILAWLRPSSREEAT